MSTFILMQIYMKYFAESPEGMAWNAARLLCYGGNSELGYAELRESQLPLYFSSMRSALS